MRGRKGWEGREILRDEVRWGCIGFMESRFMFSEWIMDRSYTEEALHSILDVVLQYKSWCYRSSTGYTRAGGQM